MTGMASGEVDIGYGGITPVLSAVEKGVPIKVVAGTQIEGSGIAVSPESDIDSPEDLAGKSIATPGEASIQYMLLQYYLEDNNMSTDDMNISAMKVAPMNDALIIEEVDASNPYVNIVAVQEGHEKDEKIQALIEVLKSDEIKQFVEDEYKGAVVMVD